MPNRRELVANIYLFALKPELATNAAAFGKKVHRANKFKRVAKDREVLIDFWVKIRQPISAPMIEVPMDAFDVGQPVAIIVLRFDARQNDVFGFVLIELVIVGAEPFFQKAHDAGTGTFWDVGVDDWLVGIVGFQDSMSVQKKVFSVQEEEWRV